VLLDARGDREDVRVEDDVSRREADLVDEDAVRALADHLAAFEIVGLAVLVEGHDHDRGAVLAAQRRPRAGTSSSPSFMEMEFTIGLPCTQRRPASITANFDESTMRGTRLMSGSLAISLTKRSIAANAVDHAFVHVDVDDLRAVLDLLASH